MYVLLCHGVSHTRKWGNGKIYHTGLSENEPDFFFIWIRWFALQSPSFPSTPPSYLHQHSPGRSAYRWAFQSMEHQSYFKTVTTLTVELSKYRVQIFSSTGVLIMQLQRALSSVDVLFIIPFYLQLPTIFLHSESDSPRCPGDKWGYYCLQAVHGASGAWKKNEYSFKGAYYLRMAWRHKQPFVWVLIVCGIVSSAWEGPLFSPRVKIIDNMYIICIH